MTTGREVVVAKYQEISKRLDRGLPQIEQLVSGDKALARRMVIAAKNALAANPDLAQCTPNSFYLAILNCAEAGLVPGPFQHAHIVRFGDRAVMLPGYKGYIWKAAQEGIGRVETIEVVYHGEDFSHQLGDNPKVHHVPGSRAEEDPAKITHAYAIFRHPDGSKTPKVISRAQIEAARKMSKAPNGPGWRDNYASMAMKTAVHRLFKVVPVSP